MLCSQVYMPTETQPKPKLIDFIHSSWSTLAQITQTPYRLDLFNYHQLEYCHSHCLHSATPSGVSPPVPPKSRDLSISPVYQENFCQRPSAPPEGTSVPKWPVPIEATSVPKWPEMPSVPECPASPEAMCVPEWLVPPPATQLVSRLTPSQAT